MGCDPLVVIEYFYGTRCCSDFDFFTKMFERDGVEVALKRNVAIGLNLGLAPF